MKEIKNKQDIIKATNRELDYQIRMFNFKTKIKKPLSLKKLMVQEMKKRDLKEQKKYKKPQWMKDMDAISKASPKKRQELTNKMNNKYYANRFGTYDGEYLDGER